MDRLEILNLIRHSWLSKAAENCSNPDKKSFFFSMLLKKEVLYVNAAAVLFQMSIQSWRYKQETLKRLSWMPAKCPICCWQSVKPNTSSNCTKWCRLRWRRASSPSDSFSWSLRSRLSQTEECINCFAEFLSAYIDDFPCGSPFPLSPFPPWHILSIPSPQLRASSQSVIERWVQWRSSREVCLTW